MKKNEKGFSLLETLVVSAFVMTTLIFLFAQFAKIRKNYENSFNYDTVEGIYGAKNLVQFMNLKKFDPVRGSNGFNSYGFITLFANNSCDPNLVETDILSYCNEINNKLNINHLLIISSIEKFKNSYKGDASNYSESVNNYIKKQGFDDISANVNTYYLIVEYKTSEDIKSSNVTSLKIQFVDGIWSFVKDVEGAGD